MRPGDNSLPLQLGEVASLPAIKTTQRAKFRSDRAFDPEDVLCMAAFNDIYHVYVINSTKVRWLVKDSNQREIFDTGFPISELVINEEISSNLLAACIRSSIFVLDLKDKSTQQLSSGSPDVTLSNLCWKQGTLSALSSSNEIFTWANFTSPPSVKVGGDEKITCLSYCGWDLVYGTESGNVILCRNSGDLKITLPGLEGVLLSSVKILKTCIIAGIDKNKTIYVYKTSYSMDNTIGCEMVQRITIQAEQCFGHDIRFFDSPSALHPSSMIMSVSGRIQPVLSIFHFDTSRNLFQTVEHFNTNFGIISHSGLVHNDHLDICCFHATQLNEYSYEYHFDDLVSSLPELEPSLQHKEVQTTSTDPEIELPDNTIEEYVPIIPEPEESVEVNPVPAIEAVESKEQIILVPQESLVIQDKPETVAIVEDELVPVKVEEDIVEVVEIPPIVKPEDEPIDIVPEVNSKDVLMQTIIQEEKGIQEEMAKAAAAAEELFGGADIMPDKPVEPESTPKKNIKKKNNIPAETVTSTPKRKNRKTKSVTPVSNGKPEGVVILSKTPKKEFTGEDSELLSKIDELLSISTERMLQRLEKEREKREKQNAQNITKQLEKACQTEINNAFGRIFNEKVQHVVTEAIRKGIASDIQNCLRDPFGAELQSLFESSLAPTIEKSCQNLFIDVDRSFQSCVTNHAQSLAVTSNVTQLSDAVASLTSVCTSMVGTIAQLAAMKNSFGDTATKVVSQEPPSPLEVIDNLISEKNYSKAISNALEAKDLSVVTYTLSKIKDPQLWLNSQVNQSVLLVLLQQLGAVLSEELELKIQWIKHCLAALQPSSPPITQHVGPILMKLATSLEQCRSKVKNSPLAFEIQFMIPYVQQLANQARQY